MEDLSTEHCRQFFGHYGRFATLRLVTAVIRHDEYSLSGFELAFRYSGKDHENNPELREFMKTLDYADSENFSTEKLRFLLQIAGSYNNPTDEDIEFERQQIRKDMKITSVHTEYLLKAVEYWKMYFKEKLEEWRQEFVEANRGWVQRRLECHDGAQVERGISVSDEGYYSTSDDKE